MKRWLIAGLAVVGIVASTMPAFADGTGRVDAHVTVASPCITVSPTSVDFGTVPFVSSNANPLDYIERPFTIATCGMVERLLGRGSDATSAGGAAVGWALGSSTDICPQANVYGAAFGYHTVPGATSWIPLTTIDSAVLPATSPIGPDPLDFSLGLRMPCVGSDGGGQLMNFSYTFTVLV
jgi:hypothetical protein